MAQQLSSPIQVLDAALMDVTGKLSASTRAEESLLRELEKVRRERNIYLELQESYTEALWRLREQ